jgi:hypothetical protein
VPFITAPKIAAQAINKDRVEAVPFSFLALRANAVPYPFIVSHNKKIATHEKKISCAAIPLNKKGAHILKLADFSLYAGQL